MHDSRIDKLAELLLDHSCRAERGERVLIEAFDLPDAALVCRLIEGAAARGVVPLVSWKSNEVLRSLYRTATEEGMKLAGQFESARMEQVQAYIGVRGASNSSQFADVPHERMDLYQQHWWKAVHTDIRVAKTKWVVLRYPTDSMAQAANMSTAAFEDYYFDVCTADYAAMKDAQVPLAERMRKTDRVRLVAQGTELEFSIKNIPVIECWGERNIPDGEVFTAPVKDSINGRIRFNTQSRYQGTVFDNIDFEFKNGKIVNAKANETEKINKILDSDDGGRYCGEFAIGVNNRIRHPMLDTLFDEKIGGSIHLTPGNAYETADNGNRSRIHWDLVLIQRPDYGGGEIWFDDELVRKDGRFVPGDLQRLNDGL
jgi:aminopeptidase